MVGQAEASEVRVQVGVAAPVGDAFAVFTQQVTRWWPPSYRLGPTEGSEVLIEPKVGGRYERPADGSEPMWGRVLEWDPPRRVVLSWQITPEFGPEPDQRRASRIEVRFEDDGPGRTVITLVHSEIERHGEAWPAMHAAVESAWSGIIGTYRHIAEQ